MGGLWSELGKKVAERWMALLALPGALYLAVCVFARVLGHRHALDVGHMTDRISDWASTPAVGSVGGQVVLLVAVLAGSAAVGLVAQGLAVLADGARLAAEWPSWPPPLRQLAHRQVARRRRLWRQAARHHHGLRLDAARAVARGRRLDPGERLAAHHAMRRVASEEPGRPTWSGDRIHSVVVRLERDYHLDLASVWPYLWLTLPDAARAEITAARERLTRAGALSAWALLYLPVGWFWWPALLIGGVLFAGGWVRGRTAADAYAAVLESATRLYAGELARRLCLGAGSSAVPGAGPGPDVTDTGPLTREIGDALTRFAQSTPPPPPPPDEGTA
ncbi:hypothetical protein [Streptomyces prasinus]|uniref:hypothetical protein n=1 Tax=Streptomyces prasinus TaxID=67345 RepID=UPI0033ACBB7E